MKFNETKFWNVYLKIALFSKGVLCKNIFKKILSFPVCTFLIDVFYSWELQIIIMPNKIWIRNPM